MSISIATLNTANNTFQDWLDKTNLFANLFSNSVMTANATVGITTGNAYVNGIFSANTIAVNGVLRGGNVSTNTALTIDASSGIAIGNSTMFAGFVATTNNAANQVIDSFLLSTYRTAKYFLQVKDTVNGKHQSSEILMTHDGTTSYMTEYGIITSNGSIGTWVSSANATHAILTFSPTANVNSISFIRTSMAA